jgi:tetratricopeptide (TPR) repeat protein
LSCFRMFVNLSVVIYFYTTSAVAGSHLQTLSGHGVCAAHQSCVPVPTNMSHIAADVPKMSVVEPLPASDATSCTTRLLDKGIDETIHICESFLNSGEGSARERATVMFTLGHAYMRTSSAFENKVDASENKTMKIWREALRVDPRYIDPLLSSASMYHYCGQFSKAEDAFNRAEKIAPNDWRIYTGRVVMFSRVHIISGMIEAAKKAMALNPDEPEVRRVYAMSLFSSNQFEEAAKQYKIAALRYDDAKISPLEEIRPENPWISLANVYRVMGKPLLAAETITIYIDSRPPEIPGFRLYQSRAEYYELAGLYGKAADDYGAAAKDAPENFVESFKTKRAMLMAQSGAKSEAADALHNILEHGSLRPVLKVQVFLRNQGYNDVKINGHYDDATKHALDTCLQDKACAPGVGRAI